MQERMAGNARLEAEAFEAASAGVSDALNHVINQFNSPGALPDEECGAFDHEGWIDADGNQIATDWTDPPVRVGDAQYQLRMYCLVDQTPPAPGDPLCDSNPDACGQIRSQLFVESRGQRLVAGNPDPVAQRNVEVRIGLVGNISVSGDGCSAMCLPGGVPDGFEFPNSNSFRVNGAGGPAITTGSDGLRDAILDGIRDNRIGNYDGGVETATIGSPWNDPTLVEAFRAWVELGASLNGSLFSGAGLSQSGNPEFGTTESPQITYFDGDVDFSGTPSGAGIMVIDGDLTAGGTPQFDGLLVVLGGSYTITGGGSGGGPAGSLVILNTDGGDSEVNFGDVDADFTGGGNALYAFNCNNLLAADSLLSQVGPESSQSPLLPDAEAALANADAAFGDESLTLDNLWNPECETAPPSLYDADDTHLRILSWRENIGWREASDFE